VAPPPATDGRPGLSLNDQLRLLVRCCGVSQRRLCLEVGIGEGHLSAFLHGRVRQFGPDLEAAIGQFLGLELVMHGSARLTRAQTKKKNPYAGFTRRPLNLEVRR
jgi:hypothetical protein